MKLDVSAKVIQLVQQPTVVNSCRNRKIVVGDFGGSSGPRRKRLDVLSLPRRHMGEYNSRKKTQFGHSSSRGNRFSFPNRIKLLNCFTSYPFYIVS